MNAGSQLRIAGHEPLPLDDPRRVWRVREGSLTLFAQGGGRRPLVQVGAGAHLLGSEPVAGRHLVAVPLGPATLEAVSWTELTEDLVRGAEVLEGWTGLLAGALAALPEPLAHARTSPGRILRVGDGETIQPGGDRVVWLELLSGQACWMGLADEGIAPGELFPLAPTMWIQARGELRLRARSARELASSASLSSGLAQLQGRFLRALAALDRAEEERILERHRDRRMRERGTSRHAVRTLAAVLDAAPPAEVSTPDVLQQAAALAAGALGARVSAPPPGEAARRHTTPLLAIVQASHLRLRTVILRGRWWRRDGGPLVAYRRDPRRPVALLRSGGRYVLVDPSQDTRESVDQELAEALEPKAHMFYDPLPSGRLGPLALHRFALQGQWRTLTLAVALSALSGVLGLLAPYLTGLLVDQAIPDADRQLVGHMAAGLFGAGLGSALFALSQGMLVTRVETWSGHRLQAGVWDRLLRLDASFFRAFPSGDLLTRVDALGRLRQALSGATVRTLLTAMMALSSLALLLSYSPPLTLIALGIAALELLLIVVVGLLVVRRNRDLFAREGRLSGLVVQLIGGAVKLRSLGAERRAFAQWAQGYALQQRETFAIQRLNDLVTTANDVLPLVTSIALFALGAELLMPAGGGEPALSVGEFLGFNAAFGMFLGGLVTIANTAVRLLEAYTLHERAQPILEARPEVAPGATDPGRLTGRLEVREVSFRYRDDGPLILDRVSLRAEPGEFIALVGPSGSGKSSLLKLLLGFERPADGAVYLDDQALDGLDVRAVRRQMGVILQSGKLSAGSLFKAVVGEARVAPDQVWGALRAAGLEADVRAMPMQLHTLVSEGGENLSVGQRQRLLIARALVLEPKILILDEATSALDGRTQRVVTESLDRLRVTRVVVAHRLSTIRGADRIYVLDGGRVVEVGSYEELVARDGLFSRLAARQSTDRSGRKPGA